jgi:hypothetical protein
MEELWGDELVLLQHSMPEWGLPCSDEDSLELWLVLRLVGKPFQALFAKYPYSTATHDKSLPALVSGAKVLGFTQAVEKYAQGFDPDSLAFSIAIRETLRFSLLHFVWGDQINFKSVTAKYFAKYVPLPVRIYLPRWKRDLMTKNLEARTINSEQVAERLAYDAIFNLIIPKLERSQGSFLFGDSMSCADCSVASCLLIALAMPLLNNPIRSMVSENSVLQQYLISVCSKMLTEFPIIKICQAEEINWSKLELVETPIVLTADRMLGVTRKLNQRWKSIQDSNRTRRSEENLAENEEREEEESRKSGNLLFVTAGIVGFLVYAASFITVEFGE